MSIQINVDYQRLESSAARIEQQAAAERQAKKAGTIRNRIRVVQAWDEC